jgi:dynamin 1-like protein
LVSYFNIVRKNIQDLVPKAIMHFLVNQAKETIQNELVSHLYKEELFDTLLEEAPTVAARRAACKSMLDVLRRAQAILNEVRESSIA